jgi:hypothetical protein
MYTTFPHRFFFYLEKKIYFLWIRTSLELVTIGLKYEDEGSDVAGKDTVYEIPVPCSF